jgi:uncharacterized protein
MLSAEDVVRQLRLEPLPLEGGFFRRTWTSSTALAQGRPAGTAIYFLLTPAGFSAFHRLDADEIWHFHAGDPVEHVQLSATGGITTRLGANLDIGYTPQVVVPAGSWQGARIAPRADGAKSHGWSLVGCTMTPGWDDVGFELAERARLLTEFPSYEREIFALTRVETLPGGASVKRCRHL